MRLVWGFFGNWNLTVTWKKSSIPNFLQSSIYVQIFLQDLIEIDYIRRAFSEMKSFVQKPQLFHNKRERERDTLDWETEGETLAVEFDCPLAIPPFLWRTGLGTENWGKLCDPLQFDADGCCGRWSVFGKVYGFCAWAAVTGYDIAPTATETGRPPLFLIYPVDVLTSVADRSLQEFLGCGHPPYTTLTGGCGGWPRMLPCKTFEWLFEVYVWGRGRIGGDAVDEVYCLWGIVSGSSGWDEKGSMTDAVSSLIWETRDPFSLSLSLFFSICHVCPRKYLTDTLGLSISAVCSQFLTSPVNCATLESQNYIFI